MAAEGQRPIAAHHDGDPPPVPLSQHAGGPVPPGLAEGSRLPEPVFTPTTKASQGHDEFMTFEEVADSIGPHTAAEVKRLTLEVYERGAEIAAERGIIIIMKVPIITDITICMR